MKKWLTMQNFGQIFKLFAFFKEKKGLISENFCYKARVKPWRFWKNWWFFGNFFEKLAQNGQILQTHFAKIPWKHWQFWWRKSTFRFSRKNRPIFKTAFCQNNEKFREKKSPKLSFVWRETKNLLEKSPVHLDRLKNNVKCRYLSQFWS